MKQLVALLALTVAVGDPSLALAVQPPGPEPRRMQFRRSAPQHVGNETTVPLTLVGGLPVIEMTVNGRGPFRFAIDTGQPFSISVTPSAMDRMGLATTGQMLIGDPLGAAAHRIPTFKVDSLSLGAIAFRHVEGAAAAMARSGLAGIDGTLGMGLFEGLMPTIDYGRHTFDLRQGALPPANGKDIVDITVDDMGLIAVPLSVGSHTEMAHLDTGNGRAALFMPTERVPSFPTRGEPRDVGVARTVSRAIAIKEVDLTAPVRVGTSELAVKAVSYPSIAPVGNIGSLGLVGMAVTIDLPGRRVRIAPSG